MKVLNLGVRKVRGEAGHRHGAGAGHRSPWDCSHPRPQLAVVPALGCIGTGAQCRNAPLRSILKCTHHVCTPHGACGAAGQSSNEDHRTGGTERAAGWFAWGLGWGWWRCCENHLARDCGQSPSLVGLGLHLHHFTSAPSLGAGSTGLTGPGLQYTTTLASMWVGWGGVGREGQGCAR
jgi:hypothetical protein